MDNELELSVVMPCLNEEETIGICIKKIREVFSKENINGEIIVVDNGSTDKSQEIARNAGVNLVMEHRKGYGCAYLSGLSQAQAKFILIADSDNTYDFYDIPEFLAPLRNGYDFVIGSRFKGKMQKGSMTWSHRYIGNPILSGMCRLFFKTSLSDIHCGMRAFTKEAYSRMDLRTLGMEFATEMVVAALRLNLHIFEVPINYYLRAGESKLNSFPDAWRHIRFMLLYCPAWLYFVPGIAGFLIGLFCMLLLLPGPFLFMGHYWDVHFLIFSSVLCILSYQIINLGVYAHTYAVHQGFLRHDRITLFLQRYFSLERGLLFGAVLFLAGFFINLVIFIEWFSSRFGALYRLRESVLAMTLLVVGLQTVFSSFFVSLLFLRKK